MLKIKLVKLNAIESIFYSCICILALIPAIEIPIFSYFDELLAVISIFYLVKKIGLVRKNIIILKILYMLLIMLCLGFFSNITSGVHQNVFAVLVDAFGVIKNHIIFLAALLCIKDETKEKVIRALSPVAKLFVLVSFVCAIINLFFNTSWSYDVRYGIRSFQFFFNNPAALAQALIVCVAVFDNNSLSFSFSKIAAFIVMILTLRSGILAIVAIYFFVYFFFNKTKSVHWYHITLLAIIALTVGWGMINEYFISKNTLRYLMLSTGFLVTLKYFPLGAGFATFGSQMSYTYYSPLYYEYGFDNVWGFNADNGNYINDNYWPMVMAQIGILGMIANIYMLVMEFKLVNGRGRKNCLRIISISIFINLMISTLVSANLTGVSGTIMYFVLAFLLTSNNTKIGGIEGK